MKYKVSALTPLLVGDGQQLAPIDYMVWKDHVNVLDQTRIFKLLARGPRLDGYLAQLGKAGKLDFASWGGFAQSFSLRRIPFEHPSSTAIWDKTPAEQLFIPSFAANHSGAYLPGSAIKGALRTGLVFSRWSPAAMEKIVAALEGERLSRRPSEGHEAGAGASQMRLFAAADSGPVARTAFKIFLTRVANLDSRPGAPPKVSWKIAGRGNVPAARIAESTPVFAEMAAPGTEFSGTAFERHFLEDQQLLRALGWRSVPSLGLVLKAANDCAAAQLEMHAGFAAATGIAALQSCVSQLQAQLEEVRTHSGMCLLCLGWGGGFASKSGFLGTGDAAWRNLLRDIPPFAGAMRDDAPFPKTRRVVFSEGHPAWLTGWVRLQVEE